MRENILCPPGLTVVGDKVHKETREATSDDEMHVRQMEPPRRLGQSGAGCVLQF